MSHETSRRLTAILAADVVGFSRLVADDEEGTLARLARLRTAFAELIDGFRGRIFNTAGDAIRAEFQSAGDAVRCAEALQRRAGELEAEEADERRIRFRIGIALGDVIDRDGDLLGDGVSLAETLEAAAPVGGICIARAVHDAVSGKTPLTFSPKSGVIRDGTEVPAYASDLQQDIGGNATVTGMQEAGSDGRVGSGRGWLWIGGLCLLTFLAVFAANRLLHKPLPTPDKPSASPASPPSAPAAKSPPQAASPGTRPPAPAPSASQTNVGGSPGAPTTAAPAATQPTHRPEPVAPSVPPSQNLQSEAKGQEFVRQWQDCAKGEGDGQIAACMALLDSPGTLSDADLGTVNHHLGRARLQKGEIEPAIAALNISVEKSPTADAYVARGIAMHQKGDLEAAVNDFTEAIKRDANNGEALNNRAWSRYKLKQTNDALADADAALKLIPGKSYAWDTRGHIREALGDKDAAIADYRKAIELDPNAKDSREGLKRLGASP